MISHRGDDFKNLYRAIHPGLQKLFNTKQPVFLSTSSAWGVMEASIRNLVGRGVLNCMCGAFSDKWLDVAKRCGKNAEPLQVDWGKHIDHKAVERHLATGKFDTVTLVHNETSTGVMNPLGEICGVLAKYPDVALILDAVSSFSGVKIDMDALGIDVMLTGAQKALALPPGFSLFSVSEKGFTRAEKIANRVTEQGREASERMQEVAGNFKGALDKSIKDQPMATLATAAIVGFVLGAIWKS